MDVLLFTRFNNNTLVQSKYQRPVRPEFLFSFPYFFRALIRVRNCNPDSTTRCPQALTARTSNNISTLTLTKLREAHKVYNKYKIKKS